MPRTKPTIHIELIENSAEPTDAELRRWVRATEILLRAKARRDARLAAQGGLRRRVVVTVTFHITESATSGPVAVAA